MMPENSSDHIGAMQYVKIATTKFCTEVKEGGIEGQFTLLH